MRTIDRTVQFRRDYKRECKGAHRKTFVEDVARIVEALALDAPLPARHRDHALTGDWVGCRNCHIKPDLVLLYRKINADSLHLLRVGSHAELDL